MFFLAFSNADIRFAKCELIWRSYTSAKPIPITKCIQIINWKKFLIAILDLTKKVFVVHIAYLSTKILLYPAYKAQIAQLNPEKITVSTKYLDFIKVFLKKVAIKLFKHFDINNHSINPKPGKQLHYQPIYNLRQVKLKILKTYIEIKLANVFIYSSKSLAKILILLIEKLDVSFYLYINNRSLNNLIMKN